MLRASFLYLSHRRGLQRFVTRQRLTSALAYRFVAGDRLDDAVRAVTELNRRGWSASLDHLGENVTEEKAARSATEDYLAAFERIASERMNANVSVKLTQLGLDISADLCRELLMRIVQRAQQLDNFVRIDMEGSAYTQRTLDLVLELHGQYPNCGVVLQSYLYRTAADVARVNAAKVRVRLVKGAYDEHAAIAFRKRSEVDAAFQSLAVLMLPQAAAGELRLGLGTHDLVLIERIAEYATSAGHPKTCFGVQMLYGIRARDQIRLADGGYKVRALISYGEAWYAWYLRRLAERPANVMFALRQLLP